MAFLDLICLFSWLLTFLSFSERIFGPICIHRTREGILKLKTKYASPISFPDQPFSSSRLRINTYRVENVSVIDFLCRSFFILLSSVTTNKIFTKRLSCKLVVNWGLNLE